MKRVYSQRTIDVVKHVCDKGSATQREVRDALKIKCSASVLLRGTIIGVLCRGMENDRITFVPTILAPAFCATQQALRNDLARSMVPLKIKQQALPANSVWQWGR